MRVLIILVSLLVFSITVHSEVYKWTDQDGNTQYGDQPPIVSDPTQVKLNAGSGALQSTNEEDSVSSKYANELSEHQERRDIIIEEMARQKAEAEINKKKCADVRTRLKMLQEMPHLSLADGDGGFRNIEDIKRKAMTNETKLDIAEFCI